jgi:uncharacterized protein with HEPN domain
MLEAIGEARGQIARLEPDFESRFTDLRLADANSARNRLSHGYHSIDYGVLWKTAKTSIPAAVKAAKIALARALREGQRTVRLGLLALPGRSPLEAAR